MKVFSEDINVPSGSVKCEEFLELQMNYTGV